LFSFVDLVGQCYHLIPAQPARASALIGDQSFHSKRNYQLPVEIQWYKCIVSPQDVVARVGINSE
jgi:hypothetical protein